jgi:hypothetical protein
MLVLYIHMISTHSYKFQRRNPNFSESHHYLKPIDLWYIA